MFLFRLADRLHKTVAEIEAMTFDELAEWGAYLSVLANETQNTMAPGRASAPIPAAKGKR